MAARFKRVQVDTLASLKQAGREQHRERMQRIASGSSRPKVLTQQESQAIAIAMPPSEHPVGLRSPYNGQRIA